VRFEEERGRFGFVAAQAAEAFFTAAQDEFSRAVPPLVESDEADLQKVRKTPKEAFTLAREAFLVEPSASQLGNGGSTVKGLARTDHSSEELMLFERQMSTRVDAFVCALLALQCLDRQDVPFHLEQLSGISQMLARSAHAIGRTPLAFAASSCAIWCAAHLADQLALRWEEVQPTELLKELEASHHSSPPQAVAATDRGQLLYRMRHLVQHASLARRLLRTWVEHLDHRRRFLRFYKGNACKSSEQDLRLLVSARDAAPAELAAQVRRLSCLCDESAVPSVLRKRPRLAGGSNGVRNSG